jgi:hypothetical protein
VITFSSSRIGEQRNLAIPAIANIRDNRANPVCQYIIGDTYSTEAGADIEAVRNSLHDTCRNLRSRFASTSRSIEIERVGDERDRSGAWDFLAKHSETKQIEMIVQAERVAAYAATKLTELGTRIGKDLLVKRTPWSLSVRFRKPGDEIVHKYSLASVPLKQGDQIIDLAHLYVMPHVTETLIDEMVTDLEQDSQLLARIDAVTVDRSLVHGTAEHGDVLPLAFVPTAGRRGF